MRGAPESMRDGRGGACFAEWPSMCVFRFERRLMCARFVDVVIDVHFCYIEADKLNWAHVRRHKSTLQTITCENTGTTPTNTARAHSTRHTRIKSLVTAQGPEATCQARRHRTHVIAACTNVPIRARGCCRQNRHHNLSLSLCTTTVGQSRERGVLAHANT